MEGKPISERHESFVGEPHSPYETGGLSQEYQPPSAGELFGKLLDIMSDPQWAAIPGMGPMVGTVHVLNKIPRASKSMHDLLSQAAKKYWLEDWMRQNARRQNWTQSTKTWPRNVGLYEAAQNTRRGQLDWSKTLGMADMPKFKEGAQVGSTQFPFQDIMRYYTNEAIRLHPQDPVRGLRLIGPEPPAGAGWLDSPATFTPQELAAMVQYRDLTEPLQLRRMLTDENYKLLRDWAEKTMKE